LQTVCRAESEDREDAVPNRHDLPSSPPCYWREVGYS
jgi:hypothetical protein